MNSNLTLSICCKNRFYRFLTPFLIGSSVRYSKLKRLPRSEFYIRPDETEADQKVSEKLATRQIQHRKHPGRLSIPVVQQPRKFERSLIKSTADLDLRTLKIEAKKLYEYLFHRQMPWTEKMFERKFDQLLAQRIDKVVEKYKTQVQAELGASPTDQEVYEYVESQSDSLNKQVSAELKKLAYNWKPSDYKTKARCLTYALARFAPDYAILNRVFNEIKKREPGFVPSHVFDFGSGVGSTVWATENTWPVKNTEKTGAEKSIKSGHVTVKNEENMDQKLTDHVADLSGHVTDPSDHVTDPLDHVTDENSTNSEARRQYFCVDTSPDMINLANELLRDGQQNGPMIFDNAVVYFRQFLPALQENQYDLTVAAFSMMEIPAYDERMRIAVNLWNKTKDFLVFVENGNRYGYTLLMEIRDYLLAGGKEIWRKELKNLLEEKNLDWQLAMEICAQKNLTEEEKLKELRRNFGDIKIPTMFPAGHVFAPCPHDYMCPRLKDVLPCKFSQSYYDLRLVDENPASANQVKHEPYIYLILRKGSRDQYEYPSNDWPRLVKPVLLRNRHVLCEMCTANGILSEMTSTKAKDGRDVYKMIKDSEFGDLLPVKLTFNPKNKSKKEEIINEQLIGVENLRKKYENQDLDDAGNLPNDVNETNFDDFFDGFDDVEEAFEEKSEEKSEETPKK